MIARRFWALACVFTVLVAGCATTPKTPPSFTTLLNIAYNLDDTVIVTATSAVQSGALTSVQAKKVLAATDSIKAALDAANAVYLAGDAALAQSKLDAATGQLSLVQSCTNAANAMLTLDACLTAGGAPQ